MFENNFEEQYIKAMRLAKKDYFNRKIAKKNPYLDSLDEIVDIYKLDKVNLGQIDVPVSLIVGTLTSLRKTSFSSSFMPLLNKDSEFAAKWKNVCKYHLSDSGISDPPIAYEYLGKFYISEGNKRVSVLKHYGAIYITCDVTRVLPVKDDSLTSKLYYEFLDYYKISSLYSIQFNKLGYYNKLLRLLNVEDNYAFTKQDRYKLIGLYERIIYIFKKIKLNVDFADAFYVLMEIYGYDLLNSFNDKELIHEIDKNISKLVNDKAFYNILCVADDEDQVLWNSSNLKEYDFIISAGDLKKEYLEYLVTVSNRPLFYVHGNHDEKYVGNEPEGCTCIDDDLVVYRGIRILGLGGSYKYKDNSKYMYTEKEMKRRIKRLKRKIKKNKGVDILVAHAPIKGYGDLSDYAHQGFECFKDLIEEYKPKYFFYGHVHKNYSYSEEGYYKINETQIINVSHKQKIIY